MRTIPAAIAAARAERAGIISHHLIWIEARDRETGDPATIGLWTGDDHQEFVVAGQTRLYYGAGAMIGADEIVQEIGVTVRENSVRFSGISPEVEAAIRGYDARLAPCQIHRAEFSTATLALLAEPLLVIDGEIDGVTIATPEEGGEAVATVTVLSNASMLTRSIPRKRSDESLRARRPTDAFLQYAKISGSQGDPWGADRD